MSTPHQIGPGAGAPNQADAEKLIVLTDRLTGTITAETELLGHRPARELAATQEEKQRLALRYGHEMAAFAKDPTRLAAIDPAHRARLREATARFQHALDDHSRRVRAMASVSERLIKAIADEVARHDQPVRGYDGKAALRPVAMSGMAVRPTSLALNQMV